MVDVWEICDFIEFKSTFSTNDDKSAVQKHLYDKTIASLTYFCLSSLFYH